MTLGNYYLEHGEVALRLAPEVARDTALAHDALARRALPFADGRVRVALAGEAVKVIVLTPRGG